MNFREFLRGNCNEEVIRKDKGYCELELKDGIMYLLKKEMVNMLLIVRKVHSRLVKMKLMNYQK